MGCPTQGYSPVLPYHPSCAPVPLYTLAPCTPLHPVHPCTLYLCTSVPLYTLARCTSVPLCLCTPLHPVPLYTLAPCTSVHPCTLYLCAVLCGCDRDSMLISKCVLSCVSLQAFAEENGGVFQHVKGFREAVRTCE